MPRSCVVNLDSIVTIPKNALQTHITDLSPGKLRAVAAAIRFALGLES
jgi:mRNA-degrading endonuclease toxin of MazEF toxin-antitoxin module